MNTTSGQYAIMLDGSPQAVAMVTQDVSFQPSQGLSVSLWARQSPGNTG